MTVNKLEFSKKNWTKTAFVVILLMSGSAVSLWLVDNSADKSNSQILSTLQQDTDVPPSPEPQLYKPLLPEEAQKENEKLPFSTAPLEPALPLVLPSSEQLLIGRRNAADCLTSAIYYEAGNEVSLGKRAVAQVVLNRVRHPAYPKTICGVVYQGAERKTGCQFTFTCDGSLARRPTRDGWEQARRIAISAITGAVEPSVGMSTHYHANYVLPYWASSLDKVSQIGTHIFYRWKGTWGRRRAFSQAVQVDSDTSDLLTSVEFLSIPQATISTDPVPEKITSRIIADEIIPSGPLLTQTSEIKVQTQSKLQADQNKSELNIDSKNIIKN